MKILVVNKFFWGKGGAERVVFELSRGYRESGHEVIPFAMQSGRNAPSPWEARFAPPVSWEGGPLARARTALHVVHSGPAARRIRDLVREVRPDVAHLHNYHHQLSPSIVDALRSEGIPCVHTLHDYKVICPNYLLYTEGAVCERCKGGRFHHVIRHRCVRDALAPSLVAFAEMSWHHARRTLERGVRCFVSPSRFLRLKLAEFGARTDNVHVVPNGVDVSAFPHAGPGGTEFVYAGRLSREKGLETLLRAVGRVADARLAVCGSGPSEAVARALADAAAPGRVRFEGRLERGALLERIGAARAVVLPSEWYENAPIAALEALACGVPVIGSRLGGIPETVRDGETGLLFPPGDEEALADRLRTMGRDADAARAMGERGRRMVETEFALSDQIRRMLEILEEAAACASR